jgi:hypothetical protein
VNQVLTALCNAVNDRSKCAQIEECLVDYGLPASGFCDCIKSFCLNGLPIQCMPCGVHPKTYKCGCQTITITSECAYNNCITSPDPGAQITVCTEWWVDHPDCAKKVCGSAGKITAPGGLEVSIVHELIHMCSKCKAPDGHNFFYDPAARCIIGIVTGSDLI